MEIIEIAQYAFWAAVFSAGIAMIVVGTIGLLRRPKEEEEETIGS